MATKAYSLAGIFHNTGASPYGLESQSRLGFYDSLASGRLTNRFCGFRRTFFSGVIESAI